MMQLSACAPETSFWWTSDREQPSDSYDDRFSRMEKYYHSSASALTRMCSVNHASEERAAIITALLGVFGNAIRIEEKDMNALTALTAVGAT